MATPSRHICRIVTQLPRRIPVKRKRNPICQLQSCRMAARPFSGSTAWQARTNPNPPSARNSKPTSPLGNESRDTKSVDFHDVDTAELLSPSTPITVDDLSPEDRATYETLSTPEQSNFLAIQNHIKAVLESPETDEQLEKLADQVNRELDREAPFEIPDEPKLRPSEIGFWAEDEDDEFGQVEDDDDDVRDEHITGMAEGELELHREIREYTRIAAWDMPLLSKYAKPFHKPDPLATPLRFRYTTYLGEMHPAQRKVVVEFRTKDIARCASLNDLQRQKLLKLLGPRWNPETDLAKMSCEKFEEAAQNKRYLGDLIGRLVAECQREGADVDLFEDVPVDTRHHEVRLKKRGLRGRKIPKSPPDNWDLTPERVQELMRVRGLARDGWEGGEGDAGSGSPPKPEEEDSKVGEYVKVDAVRRPGSRVLDYM